MKQWHNAAICISSCQAKGSKMPKAKGEGAAAAARRRAVATASSHSSAGDGPKPRSPRRVPPSEGIPGEHHIFPLIPSTKQRPTNPGAAVTAQSQAAPQGKAGRRCGQEMRAAARSPARMPRLDGPAAFSGSGPRLPCPRAAGGGRASLLPQRPPEPRHPPLPRAGSRSSARRRLCARRGRGDAAGPLGPAGGAGPEEGPGGGSAGPGKARWGGGTARAPPARPLRPELPQPPRAGAGQWLWRGGVG